MGKARKEVDDSRFIQVTKIYQCNAVMFWPRSRHLEVLLETRLFSEILQTIRRATASLPTTETLSLVNTVLDILSCPALELPSHGYGLRDYDGPVQVLADAALRWKDVSLWNRLVSSGKVDGDVEVLGMELISLAMDVFGWQCMSYSLCKMLMRCPEG
ncbi:hypothetical protein A0H81_01926 [Grifola frondosa]|uniref:Uncharacterized protein n=1 Tax=Grifola frondosa TaxID=5627 RepID=A0A1C7MN07_GRIFR|nr:hypothetical protein A0H81_01926 [Grifola frondosa]